MARACADPEIARFIALIPVPYSREDALFWIRTIAASMWDSGGAEFVIADSGTGEVLGAAGLKPPDRLGNSEIGYWVAPWARGRGVATAAVRAVTEWAFANGVPRVALVTDVENVASQRVAYASGFEREGVSRAAAPRRDGSRADLACFARLAADSGDPIERVLPDFPGGALSDGVVRLTPLTPGDADDYHAMMSAPEMYGFSVPPVAPDFADSLRRCRYTGMWWLAGQRAEMAVRSAATGDFAGHLQLVDVSLLLGQAMIGYSLLPGHRGRGVMTRAVNLLVEWAFENTSIGRIIAGTAPGNTASHRVLERAGFTRELLVKGLLPGPDGTRVDDLQWVRVRP